MTIHGMHVISPELGGCTAPVRHYRIWDSGCTWRHINTAPEVYDWSRLDYVIQQAQAAGADNFLYVLGATPQWLAREPQLPHYAPWLGPGSNSAPYDMDQWDQFVAELVTRYAGVIGSYQIWNEPQLKDFWGYDNWTVLATMTARAAPLIRNLGAKVVSGPVLPRPSSGGMNRGGKYLQALKVRGWPVDIFAAHMYPEPGRTPGRWREYAEDWRYGLQELGAPARPRWVTETNMNLLGPSQPLSDAAIQDYMPRIDQICKDNDIFKVYWYAWNHQDPSLLGIPFTPSSQGTATLTQLLGANA